MESNSKKILVVDDDARLRDLLHRYLAEQGFAVRAVPDAREMDKWLAREAADLLVLDLMLPGEDGLAICRRLRSAGNALPIVMLTARGDEVDRIIGLEMGADDYLPKPFNPRELLARIHAVLRRRPHAVPGAPAQNGNQFTFGEFVFDPVTRRLSRGNEALPLTSGEFSLLKVFVEHARQPLSRDRLMQMARGREPEAFDRSVDVLVSRLRRLIETDPGQPRYIQTVWGFGYVFVPDDLQPSADSS
ncbi:MAG TPA: two-component system response regulator OmpR [Methylococcaceae bacterium]|nr:two-component system response regulator OmpR [Methylococcaceae bacterium]